MTFGIQGGLLKGKKKKQNNLLQKAIFSGFFDLRLTKANNWFSGHIS